MAQFQTVLAVVLLITAIAIIAFSIYNMVVIGKAVTTNDTADTTLTVNEKSAVYAVNTISIILSVVIGVYAVILLIPNYSYGEVSREVRREERREEKADRRREERREERKWDDGREDGIPHLRSYRSLSPTSF